MRISLFITCYNDALFPETGRSVVRVLDRLSHEVEFRPEQTCCGQMHWNTGYLREALPIMRHFVRTFCDAEIICIPSSSCVAMVHEHYLKAAVESRDHQLVLYIESLLPRIFEFSELLVKKLGVEDVGAVFPHNGRSEILRDREAQQTLKCIRCGVCQNVCPVCRQTGGSLPGSDQHSRSAYSPSRTSGPPPAANCFRQTRSPESRNAAMLFASGNRLALAQHVGRLGQKPFIAKSGFIERLPLMLSGWTQTRDLPSLPEQSFCQWWEQNRKQGETQSHRSPEAKS